MEKKFSKTNLQPTNETATQSPDIQSTTTPAELLL